jgi:hypothetical protein
MVTVPVFRQNSKEGGIKKLGLWVKVKSALGSYQLRFDVSRFTDESRADVTPCLIDIRPGAVEEEDFQRRIRGLAEKKKRP